MRVLITRANGQLLSDDISSRSHEVVALSRRELDVIDPAAAGGY